MRGSLSKSIVGLKTYHGLFKGEKRASHLERSELHCRRKTQAGKATTSLYRLHRKKRPDSGGASKGPKEKKEEALLVDYPQKRNDLSRPAKARALRSKKPRHRGRPPPEGEEGR